jgi:hypothetical protein
MAAPVEVSASLESTTTTVVKPVVDTATGSVTLNFGDPPTRQDLQGDNELKCALRLVAILVVAGLLVFGATRLVR